MLIALLLHPALFLIFLFKGEVKKFLQVKLIMDKVTGKDFYYTPCLDNFRVLTCHISANWIEAEVITV